MENKSKLISKIKDIFYDWLEENNFSCLGFYTGNIYEYQVKEGYENEVFSLVPFIREENDEYQLGRFVYKPKNIIIEWYEHPFNSGISDKIESVEEFSEILEMCKKSMQRDRTTALNKRMIKFFKSDK